MLSLCQISKSFGARDLFCDVTLTLNSGNRYGLVGANGSGKSTLLNILTGAEAASEGQVLVPKEARVGTLRQDQFASESARVVEVAMMGDGRVWPLLVEQRQQTNGGAANPSRIAELEELIAMNGGYTLEARASGILTGLGISADAQADTMSKLSGGFRLRVLLAQVLVGNPDVLLLDEPTNHLDILSIRWLEKFLSIYSGCLVVISHDQRFLDNVTTHILDVDYGSVTLYTGNYSSFVQQKQETELRMQAESARVEKLVAEKRAFVERFRAKATKARQAQSRAKQLERMEIPEAKRSTRRTPRFAFAEQRPSGKDVLKTEQIGKSYGSKRVLCDVSLQVRRGERVAVIGPNGVGKSTLLRILASDIAADCGSVAWGHAVKFGYFPQNHQEVLQDPSQSALEFLWSNKPLATTSEIRGRLGLALFSGDDVDKRLGMLSGGEAARLVFAKLALEEPNVLVLDEPTNHLDVESIGALSNALRQYPGTVIFVSHDRWFVSSLATRIVELNALGHRDFPGTFDEYLSHCGDDHLDASAVGLRQRASQRDAEQDDREASRLAREEVKRRKNRLKALPQQRDALLDRIAAAEGRVSAIQQLYCSPGFFERTSNAEVERLREEERSLQTQVSQWMEEWETLECELSSLQEPQGAAEG